MWMMMGGKLHRFRPEQVAEITDDWVPLTDDVPALARCGTTGHVPVGAMNIGEEVATAEAWDGLRCDRCAVAGKPVATVIEIPHYPELDGAW